MSTLKEQMESLTRGIESSTRERKATVANCRITAANLLDSFHKERTLAAAALATALAQGRGKRDREAGKRDRDAVAMRKDLHRAGLIRRRWTKNISTTVASLLACFGDERAEAAKERTEATTAQHLGLAQSRRKLSHDVTGLMNHIAVAHREMAQGLTDGLHAYMNVARTRGAALHGSFMPPATPHALHDRNPEAHSGRHKVKRKA